MKSQFQIRIVGAVLVLASWLSAQNPQHDSAVTPVEGESWLNHLHRSFDETSMGKTGKLGPPTEEGDAAQVGNPAARGNVTVHGADLYRWSCRGCHGEAGMGAPPEINSVINPVRSSSAVLVMERMKNVGMNMSSADAARLAKQSRQAIVDRLHKGGQDMPSFPQLSEAEIRSLMGYLRALAGVPHAETQLVAVEESPERIGEHIVKSTCHVCHGASGPNPNAREMNDGAIPPLSTLTERVSRARFIQKVTHGAPVVMGDPSLAYRGRMPVFDYLSEEEAADIYLYLSHYPPQEKSTTEPVVSIANSGAGAGPVSVQRNAKSSLAFTEAVPRPDEGPDMQLVAFMAVSGVLVSILLAGMVGFTVWECRRLSAENQARAMAERTTRVEIPYTMTGRVKDRLIA